MKKIYAIALILFCISSTLNSAQEQLPPYLYQSVLQSNQFKTLQKGVSSILKNGLMHGVLPLGVGVCVALSLYLGEHYVERSNHEGGYSYFVINRDLSTSFLIKTLPVTVGGVLIAAKLWNLALGNDTASDDLSAICKIPFKEGAYLIVRNKYLWHGLSASLAHFYTVFSYLRPFPHTH